MAGLFRNIQRTATLEALKQVIRTHGRQEVRKWDRSKIFFEVDKEFRLLLSKDLREEYNYFLDQGKTDAKAWRAFNKNRPRSVFRPYQRYFDRQSRK